MGLVSVDERIEAIEARQRAYGMHDPDCPVYLRAVDQAQTMAYVLPRKCTCWLSKGNEDGITRDD